MCLASLLTTGFIPVEDVIRSKTRGLLPTPSPPPHAWGGAGGREGRLSGYGSSLRRGKPGGGEEDAKHIHATCSLPPATCHLPPVACRLSPVACGLPPATCRLWPAPDFPDFAEPKLDIRAIRCYYSSAGESMEAADGDPQVQKHFLSV